LHLLLLALVIVRYADEAAMCCCRRTFLVLEKRGRNSTCVTTHELNALNSRLRDAAADCMMLTVQVRSLLSETAAYATS
jgi:hypothetical protein